MALAGSNATEQDRRGWAADGPARHILHVDMDEVFAAVEKLDHPELRGKPLLIGGDPKGRGVVSTASYEARPFDCHSAMPMSQAIRLCPQAIVLPVRMHRYAEVSDQIFTVLEHFTPLIEPLSIDEAFLDITGTERLLGPPAKVAADLKDAIRRETQLTGSVGLVPNMFLAKLGSDLNKPDGLTIITPETIQATLDPLPVRKLWGVGPATEKQLARLGIERIGQLRAVSLDQLTALFGEGGEHFWGLARGLDDRPVTPDSQAKSIGQEMTFAQDQADREELLAVLLGQAEQVARRCRRHGLKARTVNVKIRYGDFKTINRSRTLGEPTDLTDELWSVAKTLFNEWGNKGFKPVRLIGVTAENLQLAGGVQPLLFDDKDRKKKDRLDRTVDEINERLGNGSIGRGGATRREERDED